jgi:predicted nucleic acid-binding protein
MRPDAVVDASVLIVLAKTRRLELLKALYRRVIVGPVVKREGIEAGKRIRARGVELLEQALGDGWLRLVRPTGTESKLAQRLLRVSNLHAGEAEALALAERRGLLLIVDDQEARNTAGRLGIQYLGAAGVLLYARRQGYLTLEELEDAVHDLAGVLWLSPSVVATVLKRAREEKR